jgi:hypothetical protein
VILADILGDIGQYWGNTWLYWAILHDIWQYWGDIWQYWADIG